MPHQHPQALVRENHPSVSSSLDHEKNHSARSPEAASDFPAHRAENRHISTVSCFLIPHTGLYHAHPEWTESQKDSPADKRDTSLRQLP